LAGARNTGILAAKGEFIAFCDDDDEWLPTKLSRQVELARQLECSTVVSGITICYGQKRFDRIPRQCDMNVSILSRRRVMEAHMSTVLVRTEDLMEGIGIINEQMPGSYGEDFDWILRAAAHGEIGAVEAPLVLVHWGQSQFSRNWPMIVSAIDYGLANDPHLSTDRRGVARLKARRAFALAAMGRGVESRRGACEAIRLDWRERRSYLAILVSLRLVSAERLLHLAHSRGRGI
jgi:glycosyltransferase involved in cell wall biosynthesis